MGSSKRASRRARPLGGRRFGSSPPPKYGHPKSTIMECFSTGGGYMVSNWSPGNTVNSFGVTATMGNFNTYGCKWTSSQIVWYLNGAVVTTENASASVPKEMMYPVLNL